MERNLNSWFHQQLSHQQSSYLNSLNHPFALGTQNNNPPPMSPCANIASANRTFTEIAFSGVPYPKQCQPTVSHGWFYGPPHHHHAFDDVANTLSPEKAPYFSRENYKETSTANPGPGTAQKRFIVFDQSGDQTTMFFSPGISPPLQLTSEGPKLNHDDHTNNLVETETFHQEEPILTYEYHEKLKDDEESVMREDTEELNALLYSDDEYYYEEEEEASTGHSPSTMTGFNKPESSDDEEEVASNFEPNKRIKFEVSPLVNSSISGKLNNCSECEDDVESSCGDDEDQDLVGNKRSRKDKIREAVNLLQSIIPGGKSKGKDAIMIFDDAIDYLKSLKMKAQALGVHTI